MDHDSSQSRHSITRNLLSKEEEKKKSENHEFLLRGSLAVTFFQVSAYLLEKIRGPSLGKKNSLNEGPNYLFWHHNSMPLRYKSTCFHKIWLHTLSFKVHNGYHETNLQLGEQSRKSKLT